MATRAAIAGIEGEARKKIQAAEAALVEKLGIEPPPPPPLARQPEMQRAFELERHAALLDQVIAALEKEDDRGQGH